jgi:hypothetical protein
LRRTKALLGRARGCDVRISSAQVSRRHCLLRVLEGYLTIEDLKSCNGTFLNGVLVEGRQAVRPGDQLRVGPITFVVEYQLNPQAQDRLAHPDQGEVEVIPEAGEVEWLEVVDEPEVVDVVEPEELVPPPGSSQNTRPAFDDSPIPLEQEEVLEDEAAPWNLPQPEKLRNILSEFDFNAPQPPSEPPPKK